MSECNDSIENDENGPRRIGLRTWVADTSPQKPETPDFLEAYPPPWLPAGSLNRAYSILIPRFVLPPVMHDKNRMR
jgi:hypothetical protein